jgi:hypothetical protein
VERIKEGTYVLGGVVSIASSKSVREDPNPDSRVGEMTIFVFGGLDAWDVIIVQVLFFLHVLVLVLVLNLLVCVFVQPSESNEINRCDFDLLLVE